MNETLKKIKIIYFAIFAQFVVVAGVVILLKYLEIIEDVITLDNKLTMIIPVIMIIGIIAAYFIYDRIANSAKKVEEQEIKLSKFFRASLLKLAMFDFVGFLTAIMLILLYQKTYIYMLGIVLVFYILNFPNELKYKKDFFGKENSFFQE